MVETIYQLRIRERQLQHLRAVTYIKGKFKSVLKSPEYSGREDIRKGCAEFIGDEKPVDLLEFGVFKGESMNFWCNNFKNVDARFFGFDSFIGLPEDWVGKMVKGTFSTDGQPPKIDDSRLEFKKGWIQNTLPDFLSTFEVRDGVPVFIHIDVDLYSAALFVLCSAWGKFDKFYVLFDEFGIDENIAMSDFVLAFPVKFKFLGHMIEKGKALPQKVFCEIEKVPYET